MKISLSILTFLLLILAAAPGVAHAEGRRIGLVVGNNQYDSVADLSKAVNDAQSVGATLKDIGFDVVIEAIDVDRATLNRKVSEFAGTIEEGDTAFFFYAGHGVAVGSVNYLLPTDFPEIGENEKYQEYLLSVERIKSQQAVGVAQAEALSKADIRIIANSGDASTGIESIKDVLSSKGGTQLGLLLEGLTNTELGKKLVDKVLPQ